MRQSGSMCPRTQVELATELPPVSLPRGASSLGWSLGISILQGVKRAFPALGAFTEHPPYVLRLTWVKSLWVLRGGR